MAFPTFGVDLLDAMGTAAAAAAAGATNSQRIHSREQWANIQITPPRRTSASQTRTTTTLMVAALTTGTPAGRAPNQASLTIHTQQGPTWWMGQPRASTRWFYLWPPTARLTSHASNILPPQQVGRSLRSLSTSPPLCCRWCLCTLPSDALHGAVTWTYPSSGC